MQVDEDVNTSDLEYRYIEEMMEVIQKWDQKYAQIILAKVLKWKNIIKYGINLRREIKQDCWGGKEQQK